MIVHVRWDTHRYCFLLEMVNIWAALSFVNAVPRNKVINRIFECWEAFSFSTLILLVGSFDL